MDIQDILLRSIGLGVVAWPICLASQIIWAGIQLSVQVSLALIVLCILVALSKAAGPAWLSVVTLKKLWADLNEKGFEDVIGQITRMIRELIWWLIGPWPYPPGPGEKPGDEPERQPDEPVDETRRAGATGPLVHDTTVDLIGGSGIFDDDSMLLINMPPIGPERKNPDEKGDGGIWQIPKDIFERIKKDEISIAKAKAIQLKFKIKWLEISYLDMRIPLHCGLFARMWIDIQLARLKWPSVPRNAEKQAAFWIHLRSPDNKVDFPIKKMEPVEPKETLSRADILFVLDGSDSVGEDNFKLMKKFIKGIVRICKVGEGKTRLGLIQYSDSSVVEFEIGKHGNYKDVNAAIDAVQHAGGCTASDQALRGAIDEFQKIARNATGNQQICIFLTDGESDEIDATVQAASDLHNHASLNMTVFAIGVGKADRAELEIIGSKPTNDHVFQLVTFDEMKDFNAQLRRALVRTQAVLTPDKEVKGKIRNGSYAYYTLKAKQAGVTIKVKMESGSTELYASYTVRNPNKAAYNFKLQTSGNHAEWQTMRVPFPIHLGPKLQEADVFLGLLGTGTGKEDAYQLEYVDGFDNPGHGWRPGFPDWSAWKGHDGFKIW